MAHLEALFGKEVTGKSGENVAVSSLADRELIGVYFSAHWCPPCRGFTPGLGECYNKVNKDSKRWEIIFVSFDRDEASCKDYYDSMPWLLMPFDSDLKEGLSEKYGVSGIPALIFVDPKTGELISKDGRGAVQGDMDGAKFPWK